MGLSLPKSNLIFLKKCLDKWVHFNLETLFPEIAAQWHPTKNGSLKPSDVVPKSHKKVWWFLSYDDSTTGKHFDFEWECEVSKRTGRGFGCPYLSGHAVWPGYNDLETLYPEIAKEWHLSKNKYPASSVTICHDKKVWWYFPYDDPDTGMHFDFEWEAPVVSRIKQQCGCPYLSGHAVWPGYNDLETKYPKVVRLWHPVKNGKLTPKDVTAQTKKVVWWYFPYDDPITGKHFDFEWRQRIFLRVSSDVDCPYLSDRAVWPGFNDLATRMPEICKEWDFEKNRNQTPEMYAPYSNKKVWWKCSYGHNWRASINSRTNRGSGCPTCHKYNLKQKSTL